jgi:hypothetical protein
MAGLLVFLLLSAQAAPAPTAEEIQKAREELRDQLRDQYARVQPEQRRTLARKFLTVAETETQAARRSALLLEAADLALEAGDAPDAAAALEALARGPGRWPALRFRVLDLQDRKDKAGLPAEAWMGLVGEALDEDDYALAQKAADKAEAAAGRRKDPAVLDQAKALKEQARSLLKEAKGLEDSFLRLKEAPEDPVASDAVGRFLCFTRDLWPRGLPYLARGTDPALRAAAQADLASALPAGDLWWDWAEKQTVRGVREAVRLRAAGCYERVLGGLPEAERSRVEKRIKVAYDAAGSGPPGNLAAAKAGATASGGTRPEILIDGIVTGHTGSAGFAYGAVPCEFIVTMAKPVPLRQIRLLLWDGEPERFYRYVIETSADGVGWQPLVERSTGEWRGWQVLAFPPRRVKAIRLKGLHCSANSQFHAVELEAYCRPVAR